MKFLGYDFKLSRVKSETKSSGSVTIPVPSGSILDLALRGGVVSSGRAMALYRKNSALATAIDMIAGNFEQIKPVMKGPDGKLTTDHEVISLLNQPNGFQSWEQFAGEISRHYLITADSHMSGLGNIRRPPLEVYAVKPQTVSVMEDFRDSFPKTYQVTQGAGKGAYNREDKLKLGTIRYFNGTLKELFHIMGFSSQSNNIQGDPLLQAIALEINQKIKGSTHNLKLIENGGRLSLVISFKEETPEDDEHKQRKKRINEDLAGPDNAGGIAVISGADMGIQEVGKSNKDMDYAKLDDIATQSIYMRYKIPLPLISVKATTLNNYEVAIGALYDQAVLPLADTMFGGLSKFLLPKYGLDPATHQITYDPLSITALKRRMLEDLEKRRKNNLETINELRGEMGREQISEGGNVLYQPANLVEVGTDLFTDDNTTIPEEDLD